MNEWSRRLWIFATVASLGLLACGDNFLPANSADCPNDVPAACPNPAPRYASDVAPMLSVRCGGCHTMDGVQSTHPFDTYEQVYFQRTSILTQIHTCMMPPADQMQLTPSERVAVLAWLKCGAPNN